MSVRTATTLARMAFLFFLAESPLAPLLAHRFPDRVAAIVLVGALLIGTPPGIVLARALQRGAEDELAEDYRRSERSHGLAAAASLLGVLLATLGRPDLAALGLLIAAGGMVAASRLLLKAASA